MDGLCWRPEQAYPKPKMLPSQHLLVDGSVLGTSVRMATHEAPPLHHSRGPHAAAVRYLLVASACIRQLGQSQHTQGLVARLFRASAGAMGSPLRHRQPPAVPAGGSQACRTLSHLWIRPPSLHHPLSGMRYADPGRLKTMLPVRDSPSAIVVSSFTFLDCVSVPAAVVPYSRGLRA
jgi:hypothetical protein